MRKIYFRTVLLIVLLASVLNAWHVLAQSASFTASADTVCQGNCITFSNTSTGTIDSIIWFINGVTISNPDSNITTACFSMAGNDTVMIFDFDSGRIDTASLIVHINPVPSPIIGLNAFCNNSPPYSTTLVDTTTSGIWSSSDTTIEIVDSIGVVRNGVVGFVVDDSATIMYTLPTGCSASMTVYDRMCEQVQEVMHYGSDIEIFPIPSPSPPQKRLQKWPLPIFSAR